MTEGQAIYIQGKGGTEVLALNSYTIRDPKPNEVLIEVDAAGLNRADILQRKGFYPAPKGVVSDVPGLEYAGRIIKVGSTDSPLEVGARVMGIVAGGAMATHLICNEQEVLPVPSNLDQTHAAAIPEVFMTAYDALFHQGALQKDERLLIHAVGSGVGTATMQLGNHFGATVIGTSRTQSKLDKCKAMGLTSPILVESKSFAQKLKNLAIGKANLIVDLVGAAYLEENIRCLDTKGRLIVVGLLGGANSNLPLGLLLAKRARVIGTVLRSRSLEEKIHLAQEFTKEIIPLFQSETLSPVIDSVFPASKIQAAHEHMESNQSFGKIIIQWK